MLLDAAVAYLEAKLRTATRPRESSVAAAAASSSPVLSSRRRQRRKPLPDAQRGRGAGPFRIGVYSLVIPSAIKAEEEEEEEEEESKRPPPSCLWLLLGLGR